jgi:hypothetical protein
VSDGETYWKRQAVSDGETRKREVMSDGKTH